MLVGELQAKTPAFLNRLHVIDFNQSLMPLLKEMGVKCTYGDISAPDVLEHAHHGTPPKIVIATIPDSMLQGTSNKRLIKIVQEVWPTANIIVTADNPHQAAELYANGAGYVLRYAKLCAERLFQLLSGSELESQIEQYKRSDNESRGSFLQNSL